MLKIISVLLNSKSVLRCCTTSPSYQFLDIIHLFEPSCKGKKHGWSHVDTLRLVHRKQKTHQTSDLKPQTSLGLFLVHFCPFLPPGGSEDLARQGQSDPSREDSQTPSALRIYNRTNVHSRHKSCLNRKITGYKKPRRKFNSYGTSLCKHFDVKIDLKSKSCLAPVVLLTPLSASSTNFLLPWRQSIALSWLAISAKATEVPPFNL
jgi:hypothetical protein